MASSKRNRQQSNWTISDERQALRMLLLLGCLLIVFVIEDSVAVVIAADDDGHTPTIKRACDRAYPRSLDVPKGKVSNKLASSVDAIAISRI